MKTKKSEYVERFTVGVNDDTAKTIRKSGESAPDWLRRAARNRIDGERQAETPTGKLEKQIAALQQRIDDLKQDGAELRKEIAKLQQSESIARAELAEIGKALVAIRNRQATSEANQIELHRTLVEAEKNLGQALATLGPTLLASLSQQLHQQLQAAIEVESEPPPFKLPPIPPRTRL